MSVILHNLSNQTKNIVYTVLLIALVFVVWKFRQSSYNGQAATDSSHKVTISGETMGTTYNIIYFGEEIRGLKTSIDSLLETFNNSLNTYLPHSEISKFNKGRSLVFGLPYFGPVLEKSREVFISTDGKFDPTVMPLVNLWGFGPEEEGGTDSLTIAEMLETVGFEKISFNKDSIWKTGPNTTLDFSAIAKGYGVDVVSGFLLMRGLDDHFVEIGGEVRCSGVNRDNQGRPWNVAILDPTASLGELKLFATIKLKDQAIATSGNYFNYRVINGERYAHTIDPSTGYPVRHEMLSASVIAPDCMTADAYATAFMVMGSKKAIELVEKTPRLEALFIFLDGEDTTWHMTEHIKEQVELINN